MDVQPKVASIACWEAIPQEPQKGPLAQGRIARHIDGIAVGYSLYYARYRDFAISDMSWSSHFGSITTSPALRQH